MRTFIAVPGSLLFATMSTPGKRPWSAFIGIGRRDVLDLCRLHRADRAGDGAAIRGAVARRDDRIELRGRHRRG